ncbi:MAG: hypothetical protein ACLQDQ_10670 [Myxococcaceae bacterium]
MSALLAQLVLLLAGAPPPAAQPQDEALRADLAALSAAYDYGRYAEVLERADARIDGPGLDAASLVALHQLAGLSAFNLHRLDEAERHMAALLRLNPDFSLDPFVYPPPTVAFVEKQRRAMAAELEFLREQRRQREAAAKAAAEEQAALARQTEAQRKELEQMSRQITVRTVEKHSVLVNFVPFGAGQFQEGRVGAGTGFAVAEGVLAIVSIVGYFVYGSILTTRTLQLETFPGTTQVIVQTGIPAARANEAQTWRVVKVTSGIGFYAVYVAGVLDALLHYQAEVVTTHVETLGPPAPAALPAESSAPRVELVPAPRGSIGLGFGMRF